jgi:hypothetical protein
MAYVLTLLPGRFFQVFQVAEVEEERREQRVCLQLIYIYNLGSHVFKCFPPFYRTEWLGYKVLKFDLHNIARILVPSCNFSWSH